MARALGCDQSSAAPSHSFAGVIVVITLAVARAQRLAQDVGMRRPRQLASQVLLLQIVVVAATVLAGTFISVGLVNRQVEEEYEQRALAIGHAVAATPDVVEAFRDPGPSAAIQPIAEAIPTSADPSFVVVANSDGIRYSHPNTELIGQRVSTDPTPALAGQAYVGVQQGTLGRSVRAKVPIFDSGGHALRLVSVGFLAGQGEATPPQAMAVHRADGPLPIAPRIARAPLLPRALSLQT